MTIIQSQVAGWRLTPLGVAIYYACVHQTPLPAIRKISFTVFADEKGQDVSRSRTSWAALVNMLSRPAPFESKSACPLISLAKFGNIKSKSDRGWSYRHNANVEAIYGVIGDYDGKKVTPRKAAAMLERAGVESLIHTTASHKPEAPRWRVIAPLSREHSPGEHANLVSRLNGALGGILARESWTLSQSYYFGCVVGVPFISEYIVGKCLDTVDIEPIGKGTTGGKASESRANTLARPALPLKTVREALKVIPSEDYVEHWIPFGQALKHDHGRAGYAVWLQWSRDHPEFDEAKCEYKWNTFDRNNDRNPVTCASIIAAARKYGYKPPIDLDPIETEAARSLVVVDADKEHLVNVDWLWPDHIPRGMLTLAAGEAGEGKSTVMAALAAIVTRGGKWPDGSEMDRPGRCIWLCVEDPVNSVLLPRAVAAGIDRKRLKVVTGVRNQEGDEMVFSLQDDLALLRAELKKQPDTDFVVIDPVTAYLHGKRRVDLNNATDLRAILSPLAKLAEQENVAIVCVTHLNKDEGRSFIHRVLGSQVWTAAARIVWAFGRMPESANHDAVMIEAKRNVGQRTAAVKYRIETAIAKEGSQEIKTSKVEWLGEDGSIGLHEVFGNQRGPRASSKQACGAWLRMRLAKGPVNANTLNVEAARMDAVFGERVYNGERSRLCDYDRKAHAYSLKSEFAGPDTPSSVATGSDSPDDLF